MGGRGRRRGRCAGTPVRELRARLSTTEHVRAVREAFEPIPVDELVVEHYDEVLAAARSAVRTTKASDLLMIPYCR